MSENELYSIDEMLELDWKTENKTDKLLRSIDKIDKSEINKQNANGDTLLHLATKIDWQNIIRLLIIKKHANPNIKNNDSKTALELSTSDQVREMLNDTHEYKGDKAKEVIALLYNKCVVDESHNSFIMWNGNPYVEIHHFLPKGLESYNDRFDSKKLDVHKNMVTLCSNCHDIMHHAEPNLQKQYVSKIYHYMINERKYGEWLAQKDFGDLKENDFIEIYANYAKQQKNTGGSDK